MVEYWLHGKKLLMRYYAKGYDLFFVKKWKGVALTLQPGMFLLSSLIILVITTYFVIDRKVILLLSFLCEIYGIVA